MHDVSHIEDRWSDILSAVAAVIDLDETARVRGAFRQARGVRDAASLLRLSLAYGGCGLSLRQCCAWAETAGVARLADTALLKRLSNGSEWLGDIVAALLARRVSAPNRGRWAGRRVRLLDATTICCPGADRTTWRLHVGYDLGAHRIDAAELTDIHGGESLGRFVFRPGDIALADAGYPHPGAFRPVLAVGADLVVRIGWNSLRLLGTDDDRSFPLFEALRRMPGVEGEFAVRLDDHDPSLAPLGLRLLVRRKDAQASETARRQVRKRAQKSGKTPDARSLEAADYILMLTTLPKDMFPASDVLALYRFRWQIELAFKRLKSLLDLGELPAKCPALAKAWIHAKLILSLLIEDQTAEVLDSFPPGDRFECSDSLSMAPDEDDDRLF
jgi:hypothetical protein